MPPFLQYINSPCSDMCALLPAHAACCVLSAPYRQQSAYQLGVLMSSSVLTLYCLDVVVAAASVAAAAVQMNRFTQWSVISFLFSGYQVCNKHTGSTYVHSMHLNLSNQQPVLIASWQHTQPLLYFISQCRQRCNALCCRTCCVRLPAVCAAVGVQQPCLPWLHALPHPGPGGPALQLEL